MKCYWEHIQRQIRSHQRTEPSLIQLSPETNTGKWLSFRYINIWQLKKKVKFRKKATKKVTGIGKNTKSFPLKNKYVVGSKLCICYKIGKGSARIILVTQEPNATLATWLTFNEQFGIKKENDFFSLSPIMNVLNFCYLQIKLIFPTEKNNNNKKYNNFKILRMK